QKLFSDARPQLDGALKMLAFHDLLHRDRGENIQRHPRVVAFAMSGCAFDHRLMPRYRRLLRGLRNIINIRTEGNYGLSLAPRCDKRCRNSGYTALDFETFFFENPGQVFRSFDFLKSELSEAEDAVDHDLRL